MTPLVRYTGIGSYPYSTIKDLSPENDQIIPEFLKRLIRNNSDINVVIHHYDPMFGFPAGKAKVKEYLDASPWNFVKQDESNDKVWDCKQPKIHIMFQDYEIHYDNPETMSMIELSVQMLLTNTNHSKLIVQDYTGRTTDEYVLKLYGKTPDDKKKTFRDRILFDFTYGLSCECSTDLTRYEPLYCHAYRDFFNPLLLTAEETLAEIGHSKEKDEIIKSLWLKRFKKALNTYHVDYRRRIRGDIALYPCELYEPLAEPALIRDLLLLELQACFKVLANLSPEIAAKKSQFNQLCEQFIEWEVYSWFQAAMLLVKLD